MFCLNLTHQINLLYKLKQTHSLVVNLIFIANAIQGA